MIPSTANPKWTELLKGELQYSFKNMPAGLMVSRLKRELSSNASQVSYLKAVEELQSFFVKY
jgi:hypothetical protein